MKSSFPPRAQTLLFYASLLALGLLLLVPPAVGQHLWLYMEARRAVIALDMAQHGHWAVPHNLGDPVLTKPPLFYWIAALAFRLAGSQAEWIPRLPSLLSAVLAPLALARMLSLAFDRRTAWFGGAVLLVFPLYHWMGHMAELDMLFVATSAIAMAAFWEVAAETPLSRFAGPFGFLFLGLSFMAKGPVAPLIDLVALGLWIVIARPPGYLRRLHPFAGLAIFLLPLAVWLALLIKAGFHPRDFIDEIRKHTGEDAPHHEGPGYYIDLMENIIFPWFYVWALAAVAGIVAVSRGSGFNSIPRRVLGALREDRSQRLFILLWFICAMVVLSAIPSKRSYYAVALMPPSAALTALIFAALPSASRAWSPRTRLIVRGLIPVLAIAALILLALTLRAGWPEHWNALDGEDAPRHQLLTGWLGAWFAGTCMMLFLSGRASEPLPVARRLCLWTVAVMAGFISVYNFVGYPALNATRSQKKAVDEIAAILPAGAQVFSYQNCHDFWYYRGQTEPLYFDSRVRLGEYARQHPDAYGVAYEDDFKDLKYVGRWERLYTGDYLDPKRRGLVLFKLSPESGEAPASSPAA